MIDRLIALLFLSFVAPASAQTAPSGSGIIMHRWSLGDGISDAFLTYSFRVPEADLRKTPAWEPSEGAPPLSRDAALKLAREALTEEERGRTSTDHPIITLEQPNPYDQRLGPVPADSCRWFYMITFPKQGQTAILAQFKAAGTDAVHLLITMSRTVVRPSRERETR
jgi:hypothetical protein